MAYRMGLSRVPLPATASRGFAWAVSGWETDRRLQSKLTLPAITARALTRLIAQGEFREVAVVKRATSGKTLKAARNDRIHSAGFSCSIRARNQRLPPVSAAAARAAPHKRASPILTDG